MNATRHRILWLVLGLFVSLWLWPVAAIAAVLGQASLPTAFGSNYILASALIGALIPGAIAVVNQRQWSAEVKGAVAALSCVLAAALLAYTQGVVDRSDILRSLLIMFTLAQVLYQTFWKPSGLAPAIEAKTSL